MMIILRLNRWGLNRSGAVGGFRWLAGRWDVDAQSRAPPRARARARQFGPPSLLPQPITERGVIIKDMVITLIE